MVDVAKNESQKKFYFLNVFDRFDNKILSQDVATKINNLINLKLENTQINFINTNFKKSDFNGGGLHLNDDSKFFFC